MQILDLLFSISLSLPRPAGSSISAEDIELSYSALSSLEDVIAILRNVSSLITLFHYLACCSSFSNFIVFYSCKGKKNETEDLGFHVCIYIYIQDTSIDPSEVFNRIVSSLCILLTKEEASVFDSVCVCVCVYRI